MNTENVAAFTALTDEADRAEISDSVRLRALLNPEQTKRTFERCVAQATDLMNAADTILAAPGLAHIAFGNMVLAFEELGKATMVATASVFAAIRPDRAMRLLRDTEDHERKLFWSLWSPWGGRQAGDDLQQIPEVQAIALNLHQSRLRAMYVHPAPVDEPSITITPEFAQSTLRLLKTQIELTAMTGVRLPAPDDQALLEWFLTATEDADKAKLVFGSVSIKKRAELGNPELWTKWLKELFDNADREAIELTKRELAREPSLDFETWETRWRMTVKLESASHSIRSRAFEKWNGASEHMKFRVDSGDRAKRRFFLDLDIPSTVSAGAVWQAGLEHCYRLLVALNAGTFGFFWWRTPKATTAYYEKIVDLENNAELKIEAHPAPIVDFGNNVLNADAMASVVRVYVGLVRVDQGQWQKVFGPYLDGLRIAAKIDIHLHVESSALAAFAKAFREASRLFEDGGDDHSVVAQKYFDIFRKSGGDRELEEQLMKWIRISETSDFKEPRVTLRDVFVVKFLADAVICAGAERELQRRKLSEPLAERPTDFVDAGKNT
jgi:AbiV family abortive infection protein